jgi:hypothetical protein
MGLFNKKKSGFRRQVCVHCNEPFETALFAHMEDHVRESDIPDHPGYIWMCQICSTAQEPVGAVGESRETAVAQLCMHSGDVHHMQF